MLQRKILKDAVKGLKAMEIFSYPWKEVKHLIFWGILNHNYINF